MIAGSGCCEAPASWSVPAPQASAPSRLASAARAAVLAISSLACSQDRPMPRWAVSIASATPNPCAHRCSRNRRVDSQSMTGTPPAEATAATCAAAKTFRLLGGGYTTRTSDRQRRDFEPPALGRGLQRQVGQLHAPGPLGQVPGERPALGGALEEQLPLHLEAVVEGHVVRHVRPQLLVLDRVGQVGVPYRHR